VFIVACVGVATIGIEACNPASRGESAARGAGGAAADIADTALPLVRDTVRPVVTTDTVPVDSDDPAIWVNPTNASASFVVGTDKGDSTGGLYVFGLDGHIDRARSVHPLMRMNNVDIEYGLRRNGALSDIAVGTERNRQMLRVFSLPDMKPIDGGGITVFDGDKNRAPMGIALYRRPRDGAVFAFVGGKSGPTDGSYIWQYALSADAAGRVTGTKVRAFGAYSGRKEIESIAVDDSLGYVYYSDEGVGVRQYYADPDSSTRELSLFATTGVVEDHEGLAVYATGARTGYIILSDQGANRIHVFAREGTASNPFFHRRLAVIPVMAQQTDGLEVTEHALGPRYPKGMLVMMSNRGAFHYYDWRDIESAIQRAGK
jgi:3-phytase